MVESDMAENNSQHSKLFNRWVQKRSNKQLEMSFDQKVQLFGGLVIVAMILLSPLFLK